MIIGIIILLLLLLALIIFLASRRLGKSPNRVMAEVSSSTTAPAAKTTTTAKTTTKADDRFADHSKDLASYAAAASKQRTTPYADRPIKTDSAKPAVINPTGPLLLNLFVEDQNTAIGKRNIHSLKSGYSLSVGGANSDFLIFLVPVPAGIGELRRNGSQLTFIPKKPKYFPDLGSNELRDCLNKTIRIISDKNYEMRFRFEMYEDPLVALNRMLVSVRVPG
jgi:Na+-transporting methylmalonyl-CoA/oxaloacetate decarboxylase gamma subunit